MRCQQMELGEPDASGRRASSGEGRLRVQHRRGYRDLCPGYDREPDHRANHTGARTNKLGLHRNRRTHRHDFRCPGVFAGGDIVTGAATVILAMGAGKRAARGMMEYMGGDPTATTVGMQGVNSMPSSCPKCRRVLDQDEICCAQVRYTWRCKSCFKLTTASPCLTASASCAAANWKWCEREMGDPMRFRAIRDAVQFELNSFHFYKLAREQAENPEHRVSAGTPIRGRTGPPART